MTTLLWYIYIHIICSKLCYITHDIKVHSWLCITTTWLYSPIVFKGYIAIITACLGIGNWDWLLVKFEPVTCQHIDLSKEGPFMLNILQEGNLEATKFPPLTRQAHFFESWLGILLLDNSFFLNWSYSKCLFHHLTFWKFHCIVLGYTEKGGWSQPFLFYAYLVFLRNFAYKLMTSCNVNVDRQVFKSIGQYTGPFC